MARATRRGRVDPSTRVIDADLAGAQSTPPRTLDAFADLARLVARSRAPQLHLRLALSLILTLAGKSLGVLAPLALGAAVNVLAGENRPVLGLTLGFTAFAAGWALIRFFASAMPQARDALFTPVAEATKRTAAIEAFSHALSLSLDFHQTKKSGALARIVERGARSSEFLLRILAFNIGPTILELILAAAVLAGAYDWRFAVVAVATIATYVAFTLAVSDWRIRHRRELNAAEAEAAGLVVDSLINYETVKSFGAEGRATGGYEGALLSYADASVKANNSLAVLNTGQILVMNLGLGAMAVMAGMEAMAGRMGPGDVTACVLILISLYQPLNVLGFAYREIRQSLIDMEAMLDLTRQVPDIADAPDAVELPVSAHAGGGEIVFEAVGFRHSARSAGLEDIGFRIQPGKTTALVGPSGSGKSTVVKLALRLLDPQSGRVLIDGHDARQVTQASLRRAVALVPQDVALFNDTLRFNIGFARPDADEDAVWAAAEAAELGEFIRALPDGLDTRVGERGLKLSGGERQRVGLARALLAEPDVMILDEATSALDSRTEAAIQATLRRARKGRTTLVVAHRLSTIADADEILVLKAGRIVERGSHEALVALGGEYAALWKKQTRGR
ncbi:MAG: ABC transporter ATP-binding protein/permease [Caulobacterales bacterium]|nr:ABC transporter ATP-binding protein/permease [Caulobacterales bacterium]